MIKVSRRVSQQAIANKIAVSHERVQANCWSRIVLRKLCARWIYPNAHWGTETKAETFADNLCCDVNVKVTNSCVTLSPGTKAGCIISNLKTRYNHKIFSVYQPREMVEWRRNQCFEDWRHFSTLRTRTEMVLETLVFSPFNHLTRLVAREDFIIHSRRESSRSYTIQSMQNCHKFSPAQKKFKTAHSAGETMLTAFLDVNGRE
jgi:hypothetical protein